MGIYFYHEDVVLPEINIVALVKVLKRAIRANKFLVGEINYIFCSDEYLFEINVKFLKHDFYTDVITFDYTADRVVSGDIYISTERVLNNSITFDQLYLDELVRVISHGLLHLIGFNDKEAEEIREMRIQESKIVSNFNFLVDLSVG
ncbi:MAG: rRNA maturation RNase YbeY [Prolixibacteraceae bacterium]|jgi:rRNA maturation RNase YbeY|nr:rRNA maturation RNase YbeY [Prolixibacteraceae bacterium]